MQSTAVVEAALLGGEAGNSRFNTIAYLEQQIEYECTLI